MKQITIPVKKYVITLALLGLALFVPPTRAATIRKVRIDDYITVVMISGDIMAGDEDVFNTDIQGLDDVIVDLDSPGGNLFAGLEIGKKIRLRNFSTFVSTGRECSSVCALMWLAGTPRFLRSGGLVGFHAAYIIRNGQAAESGVANALVGAYLTNLGLGEGAVIYITQASPSEITWLDEKSAKRLGILFERLSGKSLPYVIETTPKPEPKSEPKYEAAPSYYSPQSDNPGWVQHEACLRLQSAHLASGWFDIDGQQQYASLDFCKTTAHECNSDTEQQSCFKACSMLAEEHLASGYYTIDGLEVHVTHDSCRR